MRPEPNATKVKISTDGSAIRNGWENATVGIGVFYDAKVKVEIVTGLWPTNERLLRSVRSLGVPPRLKDHLR